MTKRARRVLYTVFLRGIRMRSINKTIRWMVRFLKVYESVVDRISFWDTAYLLPMAEHRGYRPSTVEADGSDWRGHDASRQPSFIIITIKNISPMLYDQSQLMYHITYQVVLVQFSWKNRVVSHLLVYRVPRSFNVDVLLATELPEAISERCLAADSVNSSPWR
jgi:hypothetical protein